MEGFGWTALPFRQWPHASTTTPHPRVSSSSKTEWLGHDPVVQSTVRARILMKQPRSDGATTGARMAARRHLPVPTGGVDRRGMCSAIPPDGAQFIYSLALRRCWLSCKCAGLGFRCCEVAEGTAVALILFALFAQANGKAAFPRDLGLLVQSSRVGGKRSVPCRVRCKELVVVVWGGCRTFKPCQCSRGGCARADLGRLPLPAGERVGKGVL